MNLADNLDELTNRKEAAEEAGRDKKKADAHFKEQQALCLEQMEAQRSDSFRTGGILYTANFDRVKGQVEDRRMYIKYALDNDEAVAAFLDEVEIASGQDFTERLHEMLRDLSGLHLKEDQRVLNDLAKTALDDQVPMPPGVTYRPDPYIERRKS